MLCFVFSALVVVLDQLFKYWVVRVIELGDEIVLLPGILGLTHTRNTGAAFSFLADMDMRWVLAGISLICSIVLILILLRYNAGFWGRLGLAAVLGGAVGNLFDRAYRGYVVDMFEFRFMDFAIFNIADIFITLGGITFCIYFIVTSVRDSKTVKQKPEPAAGQPGPRVVTRQVTRPADPLREPPPFRKQAPEPVAEPEPEIGDYSEYVKALSDSKILEELDLEQILSEYGADDDKD